MNRLFRMHKKSLMRFYKQATRKLMSCRCEMCIFEHAHLNVVYYALLYSCNISNIILKTDKENLSKANRNLLRMMNQSVTRLKKTNQLMMYKAKANAKRAPCRIFECWTWWYSEKPLGFKELKCHYKENDVIVSIPVCCSSTPSSLRNRQVNYTCSPSPWKKVVVTGTRLLLWDYV